MSLRTGITTSIVVAMALGVAGCTTYYMVKDPASGTEYYTTSIKKNKKNDSVKFKDAKTSATVTLQSSQVLEITEEQYKAAVPAKK